ncbi:DNA-processing protein DprA [Patescibacteria group bacterium]|nr:DNA-processing protein DprA [Patescibacteria group bacterium]
MINSAYLLALHSIPGLGPIRLKNILAFYQDPRQAWLANPAELIKLGVPQKVAYTLLQTRKTLNPEKYQESLIKLEIKWLIYDESDYPALLKEIYDPPSVLFYQGCQEILNKKALAIVGTRRVTGYGRLVTEKFGLSLAEAGLVIVSGLARGVDTVAHQSALKAKGLTIAVLGGGLKKIFPPENTTLAREIVEQGGVVLSEFAPDELSLPGNFPARNRVISGLSRAVLVTEAAEDSGSLITAKDALEQGRDVYAVPGPITSDLSKGPLLLIKQGAKLVSEPAEVLEELGIEVGNTNQELRKQSQEKLSVVEKSILENLTTGEKHIDEIVRELKLSSATVSAALVKMEIYGLVKNLGGGNFVKLD